MKPLSGLKPPFISNSRSQTCLGLRSWLVRSPASTLSFWALSYDTYSSGIGARLFGILMKLSFGWNRAAGTADLDGPAALSEVTVADQVYGPRRWRNAALRCTHAYAVVLVANAVLALRRLRGELAIDGPDPPAPRRQAPRGLWVLTLCQLRDMAM